VARRNLAFAGDRIEFFTGDLFDAIPLLCKEGSGKVDHDLPHLTSPYKGEEYLFDLITANPPYIAEGDLKGLDEDIRRYEPRDALLAGPDGLAISKRIIEDGHRYLKKGGTLIMEIGIGQSRRLEEFAKRTGKYPGIGVVEDHSGIERILWISS
jgi:release factor glutamine methyltransferase